MSLQPPPPVTSENPQAEPGGDAWLEAGTGLPNRGPPQTHGILTLGSHLAPASMAQTEPAATHLPSGAASPRPGWVLGEVGQAEQWAMGAANTDLCREKEKQETEMSKAIPEGEERLAPI